MSIIKNFFILFLAIGTPYSLYANTCQACKITDAPAPVLTEYIKNIEEIESNILSAASEARNSLSSEQKIGIGADAQNIKNRVLA